MSLISRRRIIENEIEYVEVCRSIDVVERRGYRVEVDIEHDIALFRVDGVVYAVTNICPHKREALIYDGFVDSGTVTCPAHAWRFEICTGRNVSGGGGLRTYSVIERDGFVWVSVPE